MSAAHVATEIRYLIEPSQWAQDFFVVAFGIAVIGVFGALGFLCIKIARE